MSYTSIIATESMVTIWMNILKAFSGKSLTMRIPSKAPIPITGSIRRFSEKELQVMLSQAKIWKGTFSRLTTRKNQALMPMYSVQPSSVSFVSFESSWLRPYFRASFKEPVWNPILWWGIVWWTIRDDEGFRFIHPHLTAYHSAPDSRPPTSLQENVTLVFNSL